MFYAFFGLLISLVISAIFFISDNTRGLVLNTIRLVIRSINYYHIKPLFKSHIYRIELITLIINIYLLKMRFSVHANKYIYIAISVFLIINYITQRNYSTEMINEWAQRKTTIYRGFNKDYRNYAKIFKKTSVYDNMNLNTNPFLNKSQEEAKALYRELSKYFHPDQPTGNARKYAEINRMYDEYKNY